MEEYMEYPDLQSFDTDLQQTTQLVLSTLSNGGRVSIDTLNTFISSVCESHEMVADKMLAFKEKLRQLMTENNLCHDLVMEYFNHSCEMRELCTELDKFVSSARDCHSYIQYKIQRLQSAIDIGGADDFSRILESLMSSNRISNLQGAARELLNKIEWLGDKKKEMLKRVALCEQKIGKKLDQIVFWKKITNSIFTSTLVSLAVFGLVGIALIVAQPHLAVAAAALAHTHIAAAALAHTHIAAATLAHTHIAAATLAHTHIAAATLAHTHIGAAALAHTHIAAAASAHTHIAAAASAHTHIAAAASAHTHIGAAAAAHTQTHIGAALTHGHIASGLAQTGLGQTVAANPHATLATGIILNSSIAPTARGQHWADSVFQKLEIALENQKKVIISMGEGTTTGIVELDDIKSLINALKNRIPSLFSGDKFIDREDQKYEIEQIQTKIEKFLEKIDQLEKKTENCSSKILKTRNKVVSSIFTL